MPETYSEPSKPVKERKRIDIDTDSDTKMESFAELNEFPNHSTDIENGTSAEEKYASTFLDRKPQCAFTKRIFTGIFPR